MGVPGRSAPGQDPRRSRVRRARPARRPPPADGRSRASRRQLEPPLRLSQAHRTLLHPRARRRRPDGRALRLTQPSGEVVATRSSPLERGRKSRRRPRRSRRSSRMARGHLTPRLELRGSRRRRMRIAGRQSAPGLPAAHAERRGHRPGRPNRRTSSGCRRAVSSTKRALAGSARRHQCRATIAVRPTSGIGRSSLEQPRCCSSHYRTPRRVSPLVTPAVAVRRARPATSCEDHHVDERARSSWRGRAGEPGDSRRNTSAREAIHNRLESAITRFAVSASARRSRRWPSRQLAGCTGDCPRRRSRAAATLAPAAAVVERNGVLMLLNTTIRPR